jgi:hypothetical protein
MTGSGDGLCFIARKAKVIGAALTLNPASLEATPVRWMPGDVRSSVDRHTWPGNWRHDHTILQCCVDHLGPHADGRTARHIIPRHSGDSLQRTDDGYRYDDRVAAGHGVGAPVEWPKHRGRVIAVR